MSTMCPSMLVRLFVEPGLLAASAREIEALAVEFPGVSIETVAGAVALPCVAIDAGDFLSAAFDAHAVDRSIDEVAGGRFGLRVLGYVDARLCGALLTRYQRFIGRRNQASATAIFDAVLACHRALHPLHKPLVRADLDHALDTWQWLLRLCPAASLAAQVAALFHDVERLASEADVRIEQHAPDYRDFKRAHARQGAVMTRAALATTGLCPATIERAALLVAHHEAPGQDPEGVLVSEADALSFFSLNSGGFLRYYGLEHTRRKVAYTLARLRPCVRHRLRDLQYHHPILEALVRCGLSS